jgi:raffinose/stachyose/melibiose transport system permease protein
MIARKKSKKPLIFVIIINIIIYGIAFIFMAPFIISLILAVKTPQETGASLLGLPKIIHWSNFVEAAQKSELVRSFLNSILVTGSSVLIIVLFSAMAGYAIGRNYHRKEMRVYEIILLASLMLPFQTIMIPIYKMFRTLNLLNTQIGAIIIISGTSLAFATMTYIGFVKTLPIELEEAARIEGYNDFSIFWNIILPLLKPATFTIATLQTLWVWNEFNISLLILQKNAVKTIPIQQYVFFGQYFSNYNLAFAAATLSMVPVLLFFIFGQKYIIAGLTEGAVKG